MAAAATTTVRSFHAYDSTGALVVAVRDVAQGQCWTTSIAAAGPGAYRCLAGNQILDPCFVSPKNARELACLESPWADAIVLRVTKPLPGAAARSGLHRPWAIVLGNGARCVAAAGTVPSVRGTDLGYLCPGGRAAALVDGSTSPATARYGDPAANTLRTVTVSTIWRG